MTVFGDGKHYKAMKKAQRAEQDAAFKEMHREAWEAVEISQAWLDLSPTAFACWIRFHTATAQALRSGRRGWARSFKVSEYTLAAWIRELRQKGYVKIIKYVNGVRSGLVLTKRARVRFGRANTWFVKV